MMKLDFFDIEATDDIAKPETVGSITKDSSALEVFTDFNVYMPLMLEEGSCAVEAEKQMQKAHVRLKLVVDKDENFVGVVSLDNLNNQEVIKRLSKGYSREELSIDEVMIPKEQLKAFDYDKSACATITNVIEALKENGQQHCLVLDRNAHKIRGIISASDIVRKLKLPVNIMTDASFLGIFNTVYHPDGV